ncbi:transposase [Streptomyces sviceus ATCC 29083]|uniref:Transposase n=2 Tax=Streptomyces sviceus TaxID=285530 RepID=B5HUU7_STRX2|nr:transposase [Streptomyces sviceus ATCC 29083]
MSGKTACVGMSERTAYATVSTTPSSVRRAAASGTPNNGRDGRGEMDDLPSLHTLAAGIDRDLDAVTAGLTLPWSSGAVEGHVNRIKMLKRQMFGRAGFALLRKRVLLA